MKLSAHPERRTAFERLASELKLIHGTCDPGKPWQNGIVERSHRTDNEELFRRIRFKDSEERRYQLRLWEMEYNNQRPHQALGGLTPMDIYKSEYRIHSLSRMIT